MVASRFVRPGQIYRIYVKLFDIENSDPINIIAAIKRDGIEVAHASEQVCDQIHQPGMFDILVKYSYHEIIDCLRTPDRY